MINACSFALRVFCPPPPPPPLPPQNAIKTGLHENDTVEYKTRIKCLILFKIHIHKHKAADFQCKVVSTRQFLWLQMMCTGVRYHFYADDTQLFIHLSPDDSLKSFDRLKSCLNDIQVWMSENKLKLNPDKTEFIVFGAKDRHKWLSDSFSVNILGNCLSPADVVRNLGVLFDAKICFTNHVNSVIKSCFISLRDLHRIRRFLSVDTSVVIANALVSSRLDYCNSLFLSLSS